jgi:hypothetical protein
MCLHAICCHIHEFCCNWLQGVTWSSGILLSAVVTKCLALTGKLISRTITLASSWSQWFLLGIKLIPFFRSGLVADLFLVERAVLAGIEQQNVYVSICRLQPLFTWPQKIWMLHALTQTLEGYISKYIYIPYPIQKSRKRICPYPFFEWDMLKDIISLF